MRNNSGRASVTLHTHSTVTERGRDPPSKPADEKTTQTSECRIAEPKPVAPCQVEIEVWMENHQSLLSLPLFLLAHKSQTTGILLQFQYVMTCHGLTHVLSVCKLNH